MAVVITKLDKHEIEQHDENIKVISCQGNIITLTDGMKASTVIDSLEVSEDTVFELSENGKSLEVVQLVYGTKGA